MVDIAVASIVRPWRKVCQRKPCSVANVLFCSVPVRISDDDDDDDDRQLSCRIKDQTWGGAHDKRNNKR
jgi:hypothetical protein